MGDYDYRSTEDIYRHFKFRALRKYTSEIEMLTDVIDKEKRIRVLYKEACQLKKSNSSDEVILKWCYKNDFISCNENVVTDKELVYSFKRTLDFMYSDFRERIPIHIVDVDIRLYIDFLIEKKESLEQLEFNRFQREKYIKEQESFKKYDTSVFKSELSFKIFKLFADRYV
ncbi:hypothetical protein, partial [Myroides sp. LoEW2-1]|uniref:hypothetical protein n=1 Tax=Myroides sp. LoEW2-1 TaxID=2683192 RepID=UPI001320FAC6